MTPIWKMPALVTLCRHVMTPNSCRLAMPAAGAGWHRPSPPRDPARSSA